MLSVNTNTHNIYEWVLLQSNQRYEHMVMQHMVMQHAKCMPDFDILHTTIIHVNSHINDAVSLCMLLLQYHLRLLLTQSNQQLLDPVNADRQLVGIPLGPGERHVTLSVLHHDGLLALSLLRYLADDAGHIARPVCVVPQGP